MEVLAIGLITAFNFIIVIWKFKKDRINEAVLDLGIMSAIIYAFQGTHSGMVVGMVASLVVSIYLLMNPIDFDEGDEDVEESKT